MPVKEENTPAPSESDDMKSSAEDAGKNILFCQGVDTANGDERTAAIPNLPTPSSVPTSCTVVAGGKPPPPPPPESSTGANEDTNFRGVVYESWNDMIFQLLLYKARMGDVNVPDNDSRYRPLYNWLQTQREHYTLYQQDETSSALLNADRVAVLESIDIQCTLQGNMIWQKNYDDLVAYKNEHGDVRVPRHYVKAPHLYLWVTDQRKQCKARLEGKPSAMTAERMAKLDQLGFVWQFRDRMDWNERFEKLLEYKKEVRYFLALTTTDRSNSSHSFLLSVIYPRPPFFSQNGHCVVPQNYTKSNALGKWVAKQREQYCRYQEGKHSFLTEERIDLLNSIGFVWRLKGKGMIKKDHTPAIAILTPKVQSAVQRKLVAKMKEEEKKLVELKSAMYIEPFQEDASNSKLPALPTMTPLGLDGRPFVQFGGRLGNGGGGGDYPNPSQARFFRSFAPGGGAGHGSWLC